MPRRHPSQIRHQPRKRPKQARSRSTVEAILTAAAQVFAARGYVGATTDQIAERAGASIGTLYQYFPNKDAVLVALLERHLAEAAGELMPAIARLADEQRPVAEVVRELVARAFALHATAPRLHRVLTEDAPIPDEVRARLLRLERASARAVAGFLERAPEVVGLDCALAAEMIVGVVEAMSHRLVLHPPEGYSAQALEQETVALVLRYLGVAT